MLMRDVPRQVPLTAEQLAWLDAQSPWLEARELIESPEYRATLTRFFRAGWRRDRLSRRQRRLLDFVEIDGAWPDRMFGDA